MKKGKKVRQTGALDRLQSQLKVGKKQTKEGIIDLTESDIKRIKAEVDVLQKQIV